MNKGCGKISKKFKDGSNIICDCNYPCPDCQKLVDSQQKPTGLRNAVESNQSLGGNTDKTEQDKNSILLDGSAVSYPVSAQVPKEIEDEIMKVINNFDKNGKLTFWGYQRKESSEIKKEFLEAIKKTWEKARVRWMKNYKKTSR